MSPAGAGCGDKPGAPDGKGSGPTLAGAPLSRTGNMSDILERLADMVEARKNADPESSYVSRLLARGEDGVLKKIGEEATETVIAAKDGDRLRIVGETADLWFHCIIMLAHYGLRPNDVLFELKRREGISGIDEKAARAASPRVEAERK